MKRIQKFKMSFSPFLVILLLMGFGAGYITRDLTPTSQKALGTPVQPSSVLAKDSVTVCFTPNKKCQSKIIDAIDGAKKSIFVQAYSFTDKDIATALADAALRGVDVKVLLDKSNRGDGRSAKSILLRQNISVRFDAPSGIAHNKIMIIDGAKVISGSYNFSVAAYKRNTENLLVINNPSLAQAYIQNWLVRWELSGERVK